LNSVSIWFEKCKATLGIMENTCSSNSHSHGSGGGGGGGKFAIFDQSIYSYFYKSKSQFDVKEGSDLPVVVAPLA